MSDLSIRILEVIQDQQHDNPVYLRGRQELSEYDKDEIIAEAERLTEAGYLVTVRTNQFIEIDYNLVNYFYEITDAGRSVLLKKTGTLS